MSDELMFVSEDEDKTGLLSSWKVLIVDDDDAIHIITNRAIQDIIVFDKSLDIYNAKSAQEAKKLLSEHNDFALALIDVVMETPTAGLDLVNYIRNDLKNEMIRLVIRTGQPHEAPEQEVISKYDINDYKEKTELSALKLFTMLRTSIEQYNQLLQSHEKYEETYKKMTTNQVTQLPNRLKLNEFLDTGGVKSLILINIDGFSLINDTQGFEAGNELLRKFAHFMEETCTTVGSVFHLEADHFVLFACNDKLTLLDHEYIESIKNLIQKNTFNIDGVDINISVTMGLAVNQTGNLIQKAELALKEAKVYEEGNTTEYSENMKIVKTIENTILWKKRVHDAIEDSRIYSYYQPIVNLKDNSIIKHEALVRLEYEGVVYTPYHFLDAARASGQIFEIFKIMFINVCIQIQNGKGDFSINVDKSDLLNPDFLPFIKNNLEKFNIEHGQITLEILENKSLSKNKKIHNFLLELKELGFEIAIDDFGAYCSNYSQLISVPFDYIKIDGEFIKDLDTDAKSKIITHTILDFSHEMNIPVIAEFVHSNRIKDIIKEMGIDLGQGYIFSKPVASL